MTKSDNTKSEVMTFLSLSLFPPRQYDVMQKCLFDTSRPSTFYDIPTNT